MKKMNISPELIKNISKLKNQLDSKIKTILITNSKDIMKQIREGEKNIREFKFNRES